LAGSMRVKSVSPLSGRRMTGRWMGDISSAKACSTLRGGGGQARTRQVVQRAACRPTTTREEHAKGQAAGPPVSQPVRKNCIASNSSRSIKPSPALTHTASSCIDQPTPPLSPTTTTTSSAPPPPPPPLLQAPLTSPQASAPCS
jgi:hypothetical protein